MRFQRISSFAQQYRTDSAWLNLTSSVSVANMNAVKLQTGNQPFYFNYRTRNRGKGWLSYILSTSSADFAGWKGFPVTGLEIQMYNSNGIRLFDDYIVMFRSKVAGEWLSWISNASLDIMEEIQSEQGLNGTLDASSTFSGWESRGDIQAIDIRFFESVGTSTGELPPTPPDTDFDIPEGPYNPNALLIYIDAGHGGSDPGACNGSNYEKNYTLQLSLLQKQYFEQAGYNVIISREEDRFVDNYFKANVANYCNADLYISNHINSFTTSSPNGVEVYCQVNPDLSSASRRVAQNIVANLSTMFNSRGVKTRTQTDGRDYYCVLRETIMPAVLVEHCFISNSGDLAKLNDSEYINRMAKSVVKAVCDAMPNPPIDIDPPDIDEFDLAKLDKEILSGQYNYFEYYNTNNEATQADMLSPIDDFTVMKGLQLIYLFYLQEQDGEKKDRIHQEMKLIRQFPQYKNKYMGNMDSNGVFTDDYVEYSSKKTTKVLYSQTGYCTKESIRAAKQTNDIFTALTSFIPIVGAPLSLLMETMANIEQTKSVDLLGLTYSSIADGLSEFVKATCTKKVIRLCLSTLMSQLPTIWDLIFDEADCFIKDGVALYAGDSFICFNMKYDLGMENRLFEVYFRNGTPMIINVIEPNRIDESQHGGLWNGIKQEWRDNGYQESEIVIKQTN